MFTGSQGIANKLPRSVKAAALAASQGADPRLHRFARLLSYVATAFLLGCANASARPPSQVIMAIQSRPLRQVYPRGPPIRNTSRSHDAMDSA